MWDWLQKLQQRPKAYRQRVAFSGAAALTSMVMVLWLVSLPERFSGLTTSAETPPVAVAEVEVQGFLAGVREQVAAVGATLSLLRDSPEAAPAATATPATTTSAATASSTPSVVVPILSSSTVRQLNPRPIRIATSSATSS
jgi:hypothetical protein